MEKTFTCRNIEWNAEAEDAWALPSRDTVAVDIAEDADGKAEFNAIADALSARHGFRATGFSYSEGCEPPSADEILERIGHACQGRFGSVEDCGGTVYIDEGGATFAVFVTKCEDCE